MITYKTSSILIYAGRFFLALFINAITTLLNFMGFKIIDIYLSAPCHIKDKGDQHVNIIFELEVFSYFFVTLSINKTFICLKFQCQKIVII